MGKPNARDLAKWGDEMKSEIRNMSRGRVTERTEKGLGRTLIYTLSPCPASCLFVLLHLSLPYSPPFTWPIPIFLLCTFSLTFSLCDDRICVYVLAVTDLYSLVSHPVSASLYLTWGQRKTWCWGPRGKSQGKHRRGRGGIGVLSVFSSEDCVISL